MMNKRMFLNPWLECVGRSRHDPADNAHISRVGWPGLALREKQAVDAVVAAAKSGIGVQT